MKNSVVRHAWSLLFRKCENANSLIMPVKILLWSSTTLNVSHVKINHLCFLKIFFILTGQYRWEVRPVHTRENCWELLWEYIYLHILCQTCFNPDEPKEPRSLHVVSENISTSLIMQTVNKVKIYCIGQMIKTTNKHRFVYSKIVNIKCFFWMSSVQANSNLFLKAKNLDSKMSETEQGQQKIKSNSYIAITYLFVNTKNKKKLFTSFIYREKNNHNQLHL